MSLVFPKPIDLQKTVCKAGDLDVRGASTRDRGSPVAFTLLVGYRIVCTVRWALVVALAIGHWNLRVLRAFVGSNGFWNVWYAKFPSAFSLSAIAQIESHLP